MQSQAFPIVKDLVLVGGGHSHALVLRKWGMRPVPGVRVTLINPGPAAPYTGMLPGFVAGHYQRDEIMIDLVRLARFSGARLILGSVVGMDLARREIHLADQPPLGFDVASIDIGARSELNEVPGFAEFAVSAKPLGPFTTRWAQFLAQEKDQTRLVIVGGGIGGVELAMAAAFRFQSMGRKAEIVVLERADQILPHGPARIRQRLMAEARTLGVRFETGAVPRLLDRDGLLLNDGRRLASDFTVTVAGARPHGWLSATGLTLHEGFIQVDACLRSSDDLVFASGDCAHFAPSPRPKAGVFAVRQAPVLLENLINALREIPVSRRYSPQKDYLKLVSCGGKRALADKFGLRGGGALIWRLKDRIDQGFMAKLTDLPMQVAAPIPPFPIPGLVDAMGTKPLCGGCGSKLPAMALRQGLADLPGPLHPAVMKGVGDDAAVIREAPGFRLLTTDHLRGFWADSRIMAMIAANHALSDIFAMGGQPREVLAQVILPKMSPKKATEDLHRILSGAGGVIRSGGADILGGHSSTGAEMTLGFSVTGFAAQVRGKDGARNGDHLILTKAIGTGVIMAAEMALARVKGMILGETVAEAIQMMLASNGVAAQILARDAHGMTDVTGFGLAGHLLEMLGPQNLSARLVGDQIPLLPGARALTQAGHGSSLLASNRAATVGQIDCRDADLLALLHDPQTSGGILASVPEEKLGSVCRQLTQSGVAHAVIGRVETGPAYLRVL